MINLKNILNEGLKKSDLSVVTKKIKKAEKLIEQAESILDDAKWDVKKLEDKDDTDFNDTKSVSRGLYNLRSSIQDGMRHMLRDPLRKARQILGDIDSIGKKL